jgi:hypothetical protein
MGKDQNICEPNHKMALFSKLCASKYKYSHQNPTAVIETLHVSPSLLVYFVLNYLCAHIFSRQCILETNYVNCVLGTPSASIRVGPVKSASIYPYYASGG